MWQRDYNSEANMRWGRTENLWKTLSILLAPKIRPMKYLVGPLVLYSCGEERLTIRKVDVRINAFEIKGLPQILDLLRTPIGKQISALETARVDGLT